MADVWAATDMVQSRRVALKVLNERTASSPVNRKRFRTEALLMQNLEHPNILKVYEFGEIQGVPYLVMPIADGGGLDGHLERYGALTPRQVVRVAIACLDALTKVHTRGMVHRDVKPSNILLTRVGHIWLSDFGIASLDFDNPGVAGTRTHMAPEQRVSGALVDHRADQFGVGATMFHLLVNRHARSTLPNTRMMGEWLTIPEILAPVLCRAMADDPAHRYPDCAAFKEALTQLQDELPQDPPGTPLLGSAGPGRQLSPSTGSRSGFRSPR